MSMFEGLQISEVGIGLLIVTICVVIRFWIFEYQLYHLRERVEKLEKVNWKDLIKNKEENK